MGNCVAYILFLSLLATVFGANELIDKPFEIIDNLHTIDPKNVRNEMNSDICKYKTCIYKCCPGDTHVLNTKTGKKCVRYKKPFVFNFSGLNLYDADRIQVLTKVDNESFVHLVPGKFANETFKNISINGRGFRQYSTYVTQDSKFYLESHNTYERWFPFERENFCVDYQISSKDRPPLLLVWIEWPNTPPVGKHVYLPITLSVSSFFLFIVLVVYALLPELRNLCGMILMAYVVSLFGAFLSLAVIQFRRYILEVCLGLTFTIYFFFMSSFCWMNVMSFDIWWTFRGYAKARPIHRRGEHFKFAMYCLYAWGLPLGMTIFTGIMNSLDLSHRPRIIQPNIGKKGCFMDGGEKILYLYSPMMLFIVCNWILFLMTAYNVWRLSRGTAVLDSPAAGNRSEHRANRNRFIVYLKLSIVMGINWLFEVISYFWPGLAIWYISDAYNMLMGFFIFLIFVCKIKIFNKLKKQLRSKKTQWSPSAKSYASSNSDSTSTQDGTLGTVCTNPMGPGYQIVRKSS